MSHGTTEQRRKREIAEKRFQQEVQARREAIENRERFEGLQIKPSAAYYNDAGDREPGDRNWQGYGFDLHPHVTFISAAFLVVFILLTLMFKESAASVFESLMAGITGNFGWFLVLAANAFIIAAIIFAVSRFGTIRIGGPDAKPEFSTLAWYAMLLSAGMGIGLDVLERRRTHFPLHLPFTDVYRRRSG